VKPAFKGRKEKASRAVPVYPSSAERELQRIAGSCFRLYKKELRKELPKIMAAYKQELRGDARFDGWVGLQKAVQEAFRNVKDRVNEAIEKVKLDRHVEDVGR